MGATAADKNHRFWLFKSEPSEFSISDLQRAPGQTACWSGVRNYQARNLLRDMVRLDDQLFFYHSSTGEKGIVGVCKISRTAYPDPTALDQASPYFDPRATTIKTTWVAVDVTLVRSFPTLILLSALKITKGLEDMSVCRAGNRLSIQPVTPKEWKIALKLAGLPASGA